MKIRGQVSGRDPFRTLLKALVDSSKTGSLVVTDGTTQWRLFFDEGAIIAGSSTDPEESLASQLIEKRLLPQSLLERAKELSQERGALLGHALLDLGCLPAPTIEAALLAQAKTTVARILSNPENTFEFSAEPLRDGHRFEVSFGIDDVLAGESPTQAASAGTPTASGISSSFAVAATPASPTRIGPTSASSQASQPGRSSHHAAPSTGASQPSMRVSRKASTGRSSGPAEPPKTRRLVLIAVTATLVLGGAGVGLWILRSDGRTFPNADGTTEMADTSSPATTPPVPSATLANQKPADEVKPAAMEKRTPRRKEVERRKDTPPTRKPEPKQSAVSLGNASAVKAATKDPTPPAATSDAEVPPAQQEPMAVSDGATVDASRSPEPHEAEPDKPEASPSPTAATAETPNDVSATKSPDSLPPTSPSGVPATPPADPNTPTENAPKPTSEPTAPLTLAAAARAIVRMGDLVEPAPDVVKPRVLKLPTLEYPSAARRRKIEARVAVHILVDEHGKVLDAKLDEKIGYGLDRASLNAARGTTFAPATKSGVRVKMWTTLVFNYSAEEEE